MGPRHASATNRLQAKLVGRPPHLLLSSLAAVLRYHVRLLVLGTVTSFNVVRHIIAHFIPANYYGLSCHASMHQTSRKTGEIKRKKALRNKAVVHRLSEKYSTQVYF